MKRRERGKRELACLLAAVVMLQFLCNAGINVLAAEQNESEKTVREAIEQSVSWLYEGWADSGADCGGLPNLACEELQALRLAEPEADFHTQLQVIRQQKVLANHDGLARYLTADPMNEELSAELLEGQNEDGGFGLTSDYKSDTIDTMLAIEALCTAGKTDQAKEAAEYLLSVQNPDGSWSYTEGAAGSSVLTARIAAAVLNVRNCIDTGWDMDKDKKELTKRYLSAIDRNALMQNKMEEAVYACLYDYERGMQMEEAAKIKQALLVVQEEDGSFYGDAHLTALALRLLVLLDELKPTVKIDRFDLTLSPGSTYAGTAVRLTADYRVDYRSNYNTQYTIQTSVVKGETVLAEYAEELSIYAGEETQSGRLVEFDVDEPDTAELAVKVGIYDTEQKCVGEYSRVFYVKERQNASERFHLDADVTQGKDYGIQLSWNELSDEETNYTYRIWQNKENAGWTTRSVWNEDGQEGRVKVLNVYPTAGTRYCLKNWMENTLSSTEAPAGKGLFDVTPVYINDYNRAAETYLLDEEGNYQYDVIFFGAADCNGQKDLTEASYQATQRFVDSGRGVLFGHDTVCLAERSYLVHPNFAKFADQLGIIVKYKFYQSVTKKVEVCNTGFLTSYPWKISGTLTIPTTHSLGQFCGGTLDGTVWMKFLDTSVLTDEETGAVTDAYLVTNNQLGLIMTGHSTNQATDDERKVLANTLFYLKQVTRETELGDKSFCDEAAPENVNVTSSVIEYADDQFRLTCTLDAKEKGTDYQYYVEAQPDFHSGKENEASNRIEAKALSGIQGYIYEINTNPEAMPELIQYEEDGRMAAGVVPADEDGTLAFDTSELSCTETYYLHAYAVDWEGNVSGEMIKKIDWHEANYPYNGIDTAIELDKNGYEADETALISVSAHTGAFRCDASGVLAVFDEKDNLVQLLDGNIEAELACDREWTGEYRWEIRNLLDGNYRMKITWFVKDEPVAAGYKDFTVLPNGALSGRIAADKPEYVLGETVTLIGTIKNTSTNAVEGEVQERIAVYDPEGRKAAEYEGKTLQLLPGNVKTEFFREFSSGMTGTYTVKQSILKNGCLVSENTASFRVLPAKLTDSVTGKITAALTDAGELQLADILANTGVQTLCDIRTQLRIIDMKTEEVYSVIEEETAVLEAGGQVQNIYDDIGILPEGKYLILYGAILEDGTLFGLDSTGIEVSPSFGLEELENGLYALGEDGITINYSQTESAGLWQSEGDISVNGAILNHNGMIRTFGSFQKHGTIVKADSVEQQAQLTPLPDYTESLYGFLQDAAVQENITYKENIAVEQKLISRTGIDIDAGQAEIRDSMAASGDIRIKVNTLQADGEKPLVIASLNGDIHISAARADADCLLYAPNGTVYADVSILEFKGTIVAKRIVLSGSSLGLNRN